MVGFIDPSYFTKVFKKFYKVSPGDVRKNFKNTSEPQSKGLNKDVRSKYSKRFLIIAAAIVVIALICGSIFILVGNNKSVKASIAVLPLDNLTGDPESSYFIDGLHDALIGELGQLPTIRVISRTSTLRYRNSDMLLSDIAKDLGVKIIIDGSVQCLDDSLCLIIQVIDVFPKEEHLLAHEYFDGMKNVLNVQRKAVKDIAQKIDVRLSDEQELYLSKSRQVDPETYARYLRGIYDFGFGTPDSIMAGIKHMQDAIRRDPGDPLGHAGLALGYAYLGHGMIESPESFRIAEAEANKALKLDPYLDESHIAIAMLNTYNFWDWQRADKAFKEALTGIQITK